MLRRTSFSFVFVEQFPRRKQIVCPFYRDFYGKFHGSPTCLYVLRIARKRTCARARDHMFDRNGIKTERLDLSSCLSIFSRARKIDRPDWFADPGTAKPRSYYQPIRYPCPSIEHSVARVIRQFAFDSPTNHRRVHMRSRTFKQCFHSVGLRVR